MVFARPLYFRNDDEDYPLSAVGTCFLIKMRGRFWGVTASHVPRLSGYKATDALIPCSMDSADFLQVALAHSYEEIEGNPEITDVLLYEVSSVENSHIEKSEQCFFDLDNEDPVFDGVTNNLWVQGFPEDTSTVCNESGKMSRQAANIGLSHPISSEDLIGHTEARVSEKLPISDFNGLSGGPVFNVQRVEGKNYWSFRGVVTRASKESMAAYYLDRAVVIGLIRKALGEV